MSGNPEHRSFKAASFVTDWRGGLFLCKGLPEIVFSVKLRHLHRNPEKRRLALKPENGSEVATGTCVQRETGIVEIESEWTARDREQKACGAAGRIFLRPG